MLVDDDDSPPRFAPDTHPPWQCHKVAHYIPYAPCNNKPSDNVDVGEKFVAAAQVLCFIDALTYYLVFLPLCLGVGSILHLLSLASVLYKLSGSVPIAILVIFVIPGAGMVGLFLSTIPFFITLIFIELLRVPTVALFFGMQMAPRVQGLGDRNTPWLWMKVLLWVAQLPLCCLKGAGLGPSVKYNISTSHPFGILDTFGMLLTNIEGAKLREQLYCSVADLNLFFSHSKYKCVAQYSGQSNTNRSSATKDSSVHHFKEIAKRFNVKVALPDHDRTEDEFWHKTVEIVSRYAVPSTLSTHHDDMEIADHSGVTGTLSKHDDTEGANRSGVMGTLSDHGDKEIMLKEKVPMGSTHMESPTFSDGAIKRQRRIAPTLVAPLTRTTNQVAIPSDASVSGIDAPLGA